MFVRRAEEAADAWVRGDLTWLLVHRHADPAVSPLEPEDLAALLRR